MKAPLLSHQPDEVMEPAGYLWSPDSEGERWVWTAALGRRSYPKSARFVVVYREKDWAKGPDHG